MSLFATHLKLAFDHLICQIDICLIGGQYRGITTITRGNPVFGRCRG
jgi:hypothetical protein